MTKWSAIADNTADPDSTDAMAEPASHQHAAPDYEMEPTVDVASPEQLKAIGDDTRRTLLSLLNERAATTSQLAEAMGRPRGSIGHHLKVLERAGLVRVVRHRKVRALTEKYYGRTGRTFLIKGEGGDDAFDMLDQARAESSIEPVAGSAGPIFTIRHARITADAAERFIARVQGLAEEFAASPPGGDVVYGLVAGVYPTELPRLGPADEQQGEA